MTFLSINHQGQFPAVTISFNLAPGVALGTAVDRISRVAASIRMPSAVTWQFSGYGAGVPKLTCQHKPYLILAALVVVYIILGMLMRVTFTR